MKDAIKKEIAGLFERGVFKMAMKEEICQNTNIISRRYAICIKDPGTQEERYKSRFIIQGHKDIYKKMLFYASPNLGKD